MNARSMTLLAAMISVVAIASCGDDDSTSGSDAESDGVAVTTSSLSKAEFIKKASAACNRERKSLIGEVETYLSRNSSKGLPKNVFNAKLVRAVLLPNIEAEIGAVRKLGAPAGDEGEVEAILAAQQEVVNEVKELKEVKSQEEVEGRFSEAAKMLQDYGFTACANGPS